MYISSNNQSEYCDSYLFMLIEPVELIISNHVLIVQLENKESRHHIDLQVKPKDHFLTSINMFQLQNMSSFNHKSLFFISWVLFITVYSTQYINRQITSIYQTELGFDDYIQFFKINTHNSK